jgi:hypothetical protein
LLTRLLRHPPQEDDALPRQEAAARASGRTLRVTLRAARAHTGGAGEDHYHRAESQFFRCLHSGHVAGGAKLDSVEYVFNPQLVARFEAKRAAFDAKYGRKGHSTVLLFHGTPKDSNMESILADGFDMAKVGSSTDAGFYGAGAYLSEMTDVSLNYGGRLGKILLCRVLLGKPYLLQGYAAAKQSFMGKPAKPGYDSHVLDMNFSEVVIFNSAQILPCYVLHLAAAGKPHAAAAMAAFGGLMAGAAAGGGAGGGMMLGGVAGLAAPPPPKPPPRAHHGNKRAWAAAGLGGGGGGGVNFLDDDSSPMKAFAAAKAAAKAIEDADVARTIAASLLPATPRGHRLGGGNGGGRGR